MTPTDKPTAPRSAQPRRRWFSYSLRSLLILITAFCIWLGWRVESTRRQREAIAAIERMGGLVGYKFQMTPSGVNQKATSDTPAWLWPVFGKGEIVFISFQMKNVDDSDLAELAENLKAIHSFRLLSLDRTKIGDTTAKKLSALRNFNVLNIDTTNVSDEGIEYLMAMPQLEVLSIVFADRITNDGLSRLVKHPKLQRVVWNTHNRPADNESETYRHFVEKLRSRNEQGN